MIFITLSTCFLRYCGVQQNIIVKMALGWTQALTEISTRNLPAGKGLSTRKADSLTASCDAVVWKI
jgi:hypothetical protein